MKKHLLVLLLAVSTFFAGCINTTEELTIAADGTGTYHIGMDMSGLFDMMEMLKAMDTSAATANTPKKNDKMDTTMNMRDFTDTASHLSAEQKALLQNAKMKMVMNEAEREFQIDMNFPFAKISDVEKLMAISESGSGGNIMGKIMKGAPQSELDGAGNSQMPDINSYYDTKVTASLIERKLNKEKYATLKNNDQVQGMQQAGDMLESFKMNTVINLPRAAKSVTGKNASLSADKKTLTVKATLMDLFENPDAFAYRIEY